MYTKNRASSHKNERRRYAYIKTKLPYHSQFKTHKKSEAVYQQMKKREHIPQNAHNFFFTSSNRISLSENRQTFLLLLRNECHLDTKSFLFFVYIRHNRFENDLFSCCKVSFVFHLVFICVCTVFSSFSFIYFEFTIRFCLSIRYSR